MGTKTTNYQLDQWTADDSFLRTDFNEDFAKLDAALGGIASRVPKVATGTYVGSGTNNTKSVTLSFRPKVVIAWGNHSDIQKSAFPLYSAMAVDGQNYTRALTITDTGFTATTYYNSSYGQYYPSLNENNMTYLYLAIG